MPAFYLKCDKCKQEKRKLLPKFTGMKCECGGEYHRNDPKVATTIKEVLDNGVMVRQVERLHNVEELVKEQAKPPKGDDFI